MIPQRTKEALDRYVSERIPTGHFLQAVLSNNLREALGRADSENIIALFDIVKYCYNEIPSNCWGSPEAVKAWLEKVKEKPC